MVRSTPQLDSAALPRPQPTGGWRVGKMLDYLGMLAVLAALVTLFSLLSDNFLTLETALTMANQIPDLTLVAVGMTLVLIVAGIDLSVGSVMALGGAMLAVAMAQWHWPLACALPLCVLVGLACGGANGLITVRWNIPSFIVTLGMLEVARGAAFLLTDSKTLWIGPAVDPIGARLPAIGLSPAFFIAVAVVLLAQVLLSYTVFGRYMFAAGANPTALRLSGVDPRPIKAIVFSVCGALAALAAVFRCSLYSAADPNTGVGFELKAIAAAVIGGTSLMGGYGSVVNTFLGVLIIQVLETGLSHAQVGDPSKRICTGAVIVLAVIIDTYRRKLVAR